MQNTNLTKSAKRQRFFLRLKQQWTLQAFALLGIAFLLNWSAGRFVFYAGMPARSRKG